MRLVIPLTWKVEPFYSINNDALMPGRKALLIIAEFSRYGDYPIGWHVGFRFRFIVNLTHQQVYAKAVNGE